MRADASQDRLSGTKSLRLEVISLALRASCCTGSERCGPARGDGIRDGFANASANFVL